MLLFLNKYMVILSIYSDTQHVSYFVFQPAKFILCPFHSYFPFQ